jgi:uncharacterized protein (DUF433 family)
MAMKRRRGEARRRLDRAVAARLAAAAALALWLHNLQNRDVSGVSECGLAADDDERGGDVVYTRIVSDPAVLEGKPVVKGTRISVEFLLELFASGATRADVLKSYPHLTAEDVEEALRYAADVLKHDRVIPLTGQRA